MKVAAEVAAALAAGRPVVALESTIFSGLGLPDPHGAEALARCLAAVRDGGAVPAVTAVVGGEARVGLDDAEHGRILSATRKVAARDLPAAVAGRWPEGATTVSAALFLAAQAGIRVFATGGIGGVHRGSEETGDVSGDLEAIARQPVVTVCAGAKMFLDIGRTLEALETLGVPVVALGTDRFPAFYARDSGFAVPHRTDSVEELAGIVRAARDLGHQGGVLVAVPVPEAFAVPSEVVEGAVAAALDAAVADGVTGGDITPFVLSHLAAATAGRTVPANLALAENNARVASEIAVALA